MNRGYRNLNRRTPVFPVIMVIILILILAIAAFRYRYSFDRVIGKWHSVWVETEYGVMSYETIARGEEQPMEHYVSTLDFRGDGTVEWVTPEATKEYNWRRHADMYTLSWKGDDSQIFASYAYSGERGGLLTYTDPENGNKIVFSQDEDIYVEETYIEKLRRADSEPSAAPAQTQAPAAVPGYNAGNGTYDPGTAYSGDEFYKEDFSYDVEADEDDGGEEEYIFPYSDSEYLTKEELNGMTYQEIWLAKNELYARHGRMFNNEELQEYFDSCSWYTGEYTPEEWDELGDRYFFNEYEIENRNLLKKREDKLK